MVYWVYREEDCVQSSGALFQCSYFELYSMVKLPGMFLRNSLSPMEATLGPQSAEQILCSRRKKVENSKKTK